MQSNYLIHDSSKLSIWTGTEEALKSWTLIKKDLDQSLFEVKTTMSELSTDLKKVSKLLLIKQPIEEHSDKDPLGALGKYLTTENIDKINSTLDTKEEAISLIFMKFLKEIERNFIGQILCQQEIIKDFIQYIPQEVYSKYNFNSINEKIIAYINKLQQNPEQNIFSPASKSSSKIKKTQSFKVETKKKLKNELSQYQEQVNLLKKALNTQINANRQLEKKLNDIQIKYQQTSVEFDEKLKTKSKELRLLYEKIEQYREDISNQKYIIDMLMKKQEKISKNQPGKPCSVIQACKLSEVSHIEKSSLFDKTSITSRTIPSNISPRFITQKTTLTDSPKSSQAKSHNLSNKNFFILNEQDKTEHTISNTKLIEIRCALQNLYNNYINNFQYITSCKNEKGSSSVDFEKKLNEILLMIEEILIQQIIILL